MARFHPLTVTDVRRETRDAVVVTLAPSEEDRAVFDFTQGQYLTFRRKCDHAALRRTNSICAGTEARVLKDGSNRVEGRCVATETHDNRQAGAQRAARTQARAARGIA